MNPAGRLLRDDGPVAPDPTFSSSSFPRVPGRSLLDGDVDLPAGLPAERTLAVVAFRQRHQACVDRWIAKAVEGGVPRTTHGVLEEAPVAVVEIPVLSTRWRPARRFIDGGMTSGIGDPEVLARTITVYTDVGSFQSALGIPDSDEVEALVVTRAGTVLARGRGEPTESAWTPLAAALGLA